MAKKGTAETLPAAPSPAVAAALKIVNVPGLNLPTYYVNHANFDITGNMDVRIRLGLIQERVENDLRVAEVAVVYMSLPHARRFIEVLGNTLIQASEQLKQQLDHAAKQAEAK